jgi:SAM-dependent methyltransferase
MGDDHVNDMHPEGETLTRNRDERDGSGSLLASRDPGREALLELLRRLDATGYRFVTPTPATHTRVVSRPDRKLARTLQDVLGWSLPYHPGLLGDDIEDLLDAAGALERREGGLLASGLRVSSVHGALFLHSAFPTLAQDSVFLGPDSYRFADFIVCEAQSLPPGARILDYGCGAGVGGIAAALQQPGTHLALADINPKALRLAAINAQHAGLTAETQQVASPADVDGDFDLIVTHPPFMIDDQSRMYRDGGDLYGTRLSLEWSLALADKLRPGGRVIMHTGASIVDGCDVLATHLEQRVDRSRFTLHYRELDPDIFSEDLDLPGYAKVERIAAVGVVIAALI